MIKIFATDDQMKKMAANAVNFSKPMGMGFYHYKPGHETKAEDIEIENGYHKGIFLDYVDGRMVKFSAWKRDGYWEVRSDLSLDYQSWCSKYKTWKELANSVGVTIEDIK